MNLVILGPPGAGKGTQAVRLAQAFSLRHLSSGDLLRAERARGSALGKKAAEYMDAGKLVPDEIIIGAVLSQLSDLGDKAGLLLDGFPRTVAQAESLGKALNQAGKRVDVVPALAVPEDLIVDRITGRRTCPRCNAVYHVKTLPPARDGICDADGAVLVQRPDDTAEVVKQRLEAYHRQTAPLEAYYRDKGLLAEVDGTQDMDTVFQALSEAVRRRLGME
ncbi:MAG: adenylate kinase [Phycisphaerae bacterium]|nr:adenylate kinase [Phycisphaerae bacterium]